MFLHSLQPEQQAHMQPSIEQGLLHHEFDVPLKYLAIFLNQRKAALEYDQAQEVVVIPFHALKEPFF